MAELIATIILVASILGIFIILFRKIPILIKLPEASRESQKETLISRLKRKTKNRFPEEKILQKILSRFRILTLKTEKGTDNLLQKLRKKSKENKEENDKEWQEFKDLTNPKF